MADIIKKIKAGDKEYDLDAKYWNGHEFSEITNLVHGVVDTYVIPTQTSNKTDDYKAIVEASSAQVTTTAAKLGTLTGTPAINWDKFGVGDIVLMGATSDGKVNFDRWISSVDASGNIKLDVLETQVATHHHTVNVPTIGRSITSSKALTEATPTNTTNNVARTGTAVTNVLTGTSGSVVTSVTHKSDGGYNLNLMTVDSTESGYAHSHNVNGHSHTTTFKPNTLVSRSLSVYYSLTSKTYTPHTHGSAEAAGIKNNEKTITYVTGTSASATFIKSLKDSTTTTNTGQNTTGTTTSTNTAGLTTNAQESTDTVGSDLLTLDGGSHTHSVSGSTSDSAIKTLNIAAKVITSVSLSYTKPTVQANVITSVTKSTVYALSSANLTGTTQFYNSMSVSSGVLVFTSGTVGITTSSTTISGINTITSGTQGAGGASLSFTSATQSYTSGTLGISLTAKAAGTHSHGFSHTHTISAHTHTVAAHTHTYKKTVADATGNAITSLSTSSHEAHDHESNVIVAAMPTNQDSINIVIGGASAAVVRELKNTDVSLNTDSRTATTTTVYTKISGTIQYPSLEIGYKNLGTTSITPAVDTGEKAIKSISYTSSNFLTGVTITSTNNTVKTSTNNGGN